MGFIAFMISITLTVNAQKGRWFVGGQLGIGGSNNKIISNSGTSETGKTFSWNLSPEVGTFVTENMQLGTALTIGSGTGPSFGGFGEIRSSNYGAKLYSRYFWGKNQFKPFAGIETSYIKDIRNSRNGPNSSKTWNNNTSVMINFGFSYDLSKRIAVLGQFGTLGYNRSISSPNPENERFVTNSFGFNSSSLGNRFNVGFYYTFKIK